MEKSNKKIISKKIHTIPEQDHSTYVAATAQQKTIRHCEVNAFNRYHSNVIALACLMDF